MGTKKTAELPKCFGSAKYGIEPHEAPIEDFPKQPSQKDALGRTCRTHWNQYTPLASRASSFDDRGCWSAGPY